MERVEAVYRIIPDCAISSDVITGFCSETEEEHKDTLTMMEWAQYSMSYMFFYSERPGTLAARKLKDDVPEEIKKRRLQEIVELQRNISLQHNLKDVGKVFEVLIEGDSKKSDQYFKGRTSQNKMVVFPKTENLKPGDYVFVKIVDATGATLKGEMIQN
jgi:tRNA-2-methylthio-N6-dimethylallyladenosine synthase